MQPQIFTVQSWCPGDSCDPCNWLGAGSFVTSTDSYYDGLNRIIGQHAQFNFGKTFYPLAVPVFETVSRYFDFSGQVVLYPDLPSRQLTGNAYIGQSQDSYTPISYYITPSYLQLDLMGSTIYRTDLSMIRNFFGYAGPGPTDHPIAADGWQIETDPYDVIPLEPNQLTYQPYRADDVTNTPVAPADLEAAVLYNGYQSITGNLSFTLGTLADGTPDRSIYPMEGFVYGGPAPSSGNDDVIADLYIMNYSGCWNAQFGTIINTLWYRGPNLFF